MFPIPPDETLVETKVCKHCGISFPITDKDIEFYEKVSPVFPVGNRHPELVSGSSSVSGQKKEEDAETSSAGRSILEGDKIRYLIPPPTLCPDCRQQRRLSFRNERKLYKRKCDATRKEIVSIYSPDKPYTIYHQDYWWSDKWNPMDYGRGFDFSRGFFEQFGELLREVPKMGLFVMQNENSPYVNAVGFSKNIHLSSDVLHSENVYFSSMLKEVRNCCDVYDIQQSEDCYECLFSQKLFNCRFVVMSEAIHNSAFIYSCYNLENCLFCANLRNKKYHILNRSVSREEYDDVYGKILDGTYFGLLQQYQSLLLQTPVKNLRLTNTELSTGELLKNTSNAIDCYQSIDIKDCKYVIIGQDMADCMDTTIHNPDCSLDYEAISGGRLRQCAYNVATVESRNIYYCMDIVQSSHCFACVGLRNKQYCILNRQYTKEEYETLVPKIIEHMIVTGEWGEFFPSSLSPFGYNETVAQEYFPMSRDSVIPAKVFERSEGYPCGTGIHVSERDSGYISELDSVTSTEGQKPETRDTEISSAGREVSLRGVEGNETTKQSSVPMVSVSSTSGSSGSPHFVRDDETKEDSDTFLHGPIFNWSDYEPPFPKVDKIIPARKLPEDISSIPDDILNWAIECEVTGKPFRIIPQELEFYRKHHLPIPRRHPDQRHLDRMKMRNPRKLYERVCDCPECEINNKTSLSSFSSNENPFGTRERDSPTENDKETVDTFVLNPRTGKRGKKIITTYSPERAESVYCEVCYEREVVG